MVGETSLVGCTVEVEVEVLILGSEVVIIELVVGETSLVEGWTVELEVEVLILGSDVGLFVVGVLLVVGKSVLRVEAVVGLRVAVVKGFTVVVVEKGLGVRVGQTVVVVFWFGTHL